MKLRKTQVTYGTGRCQFKICVCIQTTHVCRVLNPGAACAFLHISLTALCGRGPVASHRWRDRGRR